MKDSYAVALGKKGGLARAKKLSAEQLRESARKAVNARWAKERANKSAREAITEKNGERK